MVIGIVEYHFQILCLRIFEKSHEIGLRIFQYDLIGLQVVLRKS